MATIKFKRGTHDVVTGYTHGKIGEPILDTDNNKLYVGQGEGNLPILLAGDSTINTIIITSNTIAQSNTTYLVDARSDDVTIDLPPSPSPGDIVNVTDAFNQATTNQITVSGNGNNINGVLSNSTILYDGSTVQFIYVDSTIGWKTLSEVGMTQSTSSYESYIATEGQDTFNIIYTPGEDIVEVIVNGVTLSSDDYIATNGTDVVLDTPVSEGDNVIIHAYTQTYTNNTGKVLVDETDIHDYLENKFSNLFEKKFSKITLKMQNNPINRYIMAWNSTTEKFIWIPAPTDSYTESFESAASWIVNHNLGTFENVVQCWTSTHELITDMSITQNTANQLTITHTSPKIGYVIIISRNTAEILNEYSVTLNVNNSSMGSVSGNGTFDEGSSVTVTATPTSGHQFVRWEESSSTVSTSSSYTFTLSDNRTLTAIFQVVSSGTIVMTNSDLESQASNPSLPFDASLTGNDYIFEIDASLSNTFYISNFSSSHIIRFYNSLTGSLGDLNVSNSDYTDGSAILTVRSADLYLSDLPNSIFWNADSFTNIYGSESLEITL